MRIADVERGAWRMSNLVVCGNVMAADRTTARDAKLAHALAPLAMKLTLLAPLVSVLLLSSAMAADLPLNFDRATRVAPAAGVGRTPSASCPRAACIRDCRSNGGPLVSVCESLCGEACPGR